MSTVSRRPVGLTMGAALVLALGVADAAAFTVKSATLSAGVVSISGGQAARFAPISWEGTVVTTSSKGGGFSFTTSVVPGDCVGTLSDGATTVDVIVSGCGTARVLLPGSGQTVSYAPRDDGEIRAQGTLSYIDNGNGTVTDNVSGLTWEKKTNTNVNEVYTWADALAYVAALNAMNGGQGFAGYNDWRMPNVRELQSILDYGRLQPMIDPTFGPTVGILNFVNFWSSTTAVTVYYPGTSAWAVDFLNGEMLAFGKGSFLRIRAVRGGL
jgi:Protein of unknown function (DUF1566)